MKIEIEISDAKYKALKRCAEMGMGLSAEQKAILEGNIISERKEEEEKENGENRTSF